MTTLEFSAMVQQYQSLVYTVCHQLVPDVGDAQDLTQETFLAAWRAIDRCPPGFEKQWLARIAANKAKDYLRSAWVRRVNTPGDEVLALEGAPPGLEPEQQVQMCIRDRNTGKNWDEIRYELDLVEPVCVLHDGEYMSREPALGQAYGDRLVPMDAFTAFEPAKMCIRDRACSAILMPP